MESIEIQRILPHRFPFLLVDRVIELKPGKKAVAIKNVTSTEPFFQGHYPGRPIMPGVLIIEAMAQVCGIAALSAQEALGKIPYFVGIDRARFRKPVLPGDQIRIEAEITNVRKNMGRASASAYVEDRLVADSELTFALVDGEQEESQKGEA
ncbi:MAG: 3-hydroxyacyl-ACP dehydratase FabZ [Firmicutes bacterium]|nr:3-hydroxyacyl-ACP dehydratase FabZ [Bacillota bacterium]